MYMFDCAKCYIGEYDVGSNGVRSIQSCSFDIIEGEAKVIQRNPVKVKDGDGGRPYLIEVYLIFPITKFVKLRIYNSNRGRDLTLRKAEYHPVNMFRQRL
jgi:hypothetical protein